MSAQHAARSGEPVVVGIDVGQSGIRIASSGVTAATETGFTSRGGLREVADAIKILLSQLTHARGKRVVAVGLTGDHGTKALTAFARDLRSLGGFAEVRIAHDGLTAHLGALGGLDGVVVAAGTGTVCLARHADDLHRVDGWGHLLGDAGSGYAIGRGALRAAAAAADRRMGPTLLLNLAIRRYGDLMSLADPSASVPPSVVAAFTRDVAEAARAQDPIALEIWRTATGEVVRTCRAGISWCAQRGMEPVPVVGTGGLFQVDDLFARPWHEALQRIPNVDVRQPAGDALAGALSLGTLDVEAAIGCGTLIVREA